MNRNVVDFVIKRILTPIVFGYMQIVAWTSHWRIIKRRQIDDIRTYNKPVIFAFWHNQLVLMPSWYKNSFPEKPLSVLISKSKDGEYIQKVIDYFKFSIVRGSSRRGGDKALLGLIDKLKKGSMIAITPDGPRGPRYVVQKGVIKLAQTTGCEIIPVAYDSNWKIVLRTWDRLKVPLPLGNIYAICGNPIIVSSEASKDELEDNRRLLEDELNRINREVARRVAWWWGRK